MEAFLFFLAAMATILYLDHRLSAITARVRKLEIQQSQGDEPWPY